MFKAPLVWLILLSVCLVGCASTSSTSMVNADGTWTRTLKLTVRDMPSFGGDAKQEKKPDTFGLPTGPEWTKTEEKKDEGLITTLKRTLKVDEGPVTDIIIKDKNGTKYKNFVIVRKLDGNRLEYYEKIVLVGTKSTRTEGEMQDFVKQLKELLPAGKATDDDMKVVAKKTEVALMHMMFGPDDHLFGMMLTNIDGAARRIRSKVGAAENRILAEQFGNRLTDEERTTAIKKMLAKFDSAEAFDPKKSAATADPSDSTSAFLGMSTAVKLPGKIVETNGEIDEYTGEVYWDFMSDSAEPDVLELRAICQL